MHRLYQEQYLPIESKEAWDFFSSPLNLSKITPPDMGFKIISEGEQGVMREGQIIDYIVKPLFHFPLKWRTKIKDVSAPDYFTDIQMKGPYKIWEHTHRFIAVEGGVKMIDEVKYELPFGIIGKMAHSIFIRKRIEFIFNYRRKILEKLFRKHDD